MHYSPLLPDEPRCTQHDELEEPVIRESHSCRRNSSIHSLSMAVSFRAVLSQKLPQNNSFFPIDLKTTLGWENNAVWTVIDRDLESKWGKPIKFFNNIIKLLVRKLGTLHGKNLICSHLLKASKPWDLGCIWSQPSRGLWELPAMKRSLDRYL